MFKTAQFSEKNCVNRWLIHPLYTICFIQPAVYSVSENMLVYQELEYSAVPTKEGNQWFAMQNKNTTRQSSLSFDPNLWYRDGVETWNIWSIARHRFYMNFVNKLSKSWNCDWMHEWLETIKLKEALNFL